MHRIAKRVPTVWWAPDDERARRERGRRSTRRRSMFTCTSRTQARSGRCSRCGRTSIEGARAPPRRGGRDPHDVRPRPGHWEGREATRTRSSTYASQGPAGSGRATLKLLQTWAPASTTCCRSTGCRGESRCSPTAARTCPGAQIRIMRDDAHSRMPALAWSHRARKWNRVFTTHSSQGKTVLIVGVGAIGGGIAEHAKAAGMRVLGIRRSGEAHPTWTRCTLRTRCTRSCRARTS